MTLAEIYQTVFPIEGGVDDNNKYIDMSTHDISTVQLLEPTIGVDEFNLTQKDRVTQNAIPDRMSFRLPFVSINDYIIKQEMIIDFCLDYSAFIPTIMVEFADINNELLSINSIKDGAIIKVYVGGNGDELYYKPIRQDFSVTNVQKMGSGTQNDGDWLHYRLEGVLNVPIGHRKDSWSNQATTSTQELANLAIYAGLGFSTNFTFTTIDSMQWINTNNDTNFDFMKHIANHACYSPNTFFTAFVDQYYVLNFVECHRLLSHGGKKTDTPAMIYANIQEDSEPNVEKEDGINKKTTDQIHVGKNEDDLFNKNQKISYYFITNYHYYNGWSNFIESYNELNDGYSSVGEGYVKHVFYGDSNSSGLGSQVEFFIRPIDNLKRESSTQEIQELPWTCKQDTYVPTNLMHMNNVEYQKEGVSDIDKLNDVESHVNFGQVDTSNMFKQYYFAEAQNEYQMTFMKKCGLRVVLQNYNPSITKFSRIWVDLFDMNGNSSQSIKKQDENSHFKNSLMQEFIEETNYNIIQFDDEGIMDTKTEFDIIEQKEKEDKTNTNFPRGNYNRSLSGWYVVTELKFLYDSSDKNIKTHLLLSRIEERPTFKNKYDITKKGVDKYKQENKIENIFNVVADYSYSENGATGTDGTSDENGTTNEGSNGETTTGSTSGSIGSSVSGNYTGTGSFKKPSGDINFEKYFFPSSRYVSAPGIKHKCICIHHTAGHANPYSAFSKDTGGTVLAEFVIGGIEPIDSSKKYNGKVIQLFDGTNARGAHLGIKGKAVQLSNTCIGIEMCNIGWLDKNNKDYTGKIYTNLSQFYTLSSPHRGYTVYQKYSDEQLKSLYKLLKYLSARDGIDLHKGLYTWIKQSTSATVKDAFTYKPNAVSDSMTGIIVHSNIREDKFDCPPQPELIDMILSL